MPECTAPVWPCAMTGAAACLAGIEGLRVVIHGPSGCFYYPASLLHAPVTGTFLLPEEVICGSLDRLSAVVDPIATGGEIPAVITTCPTSLTGEDIPAALAGSGALVVDCAGFDGFLEEGYRAAIHAIHPEKRDDIAGVNIDGLSVVDPFSRGNHHEAVRLLGIAGLPVGSLLCSGPIRSVCRCAPFTAGTNPDFASGMGERTGGLLGIEETCRTIDSLCARFPGSDPGPVLSEAEVAREKIDRAADKYLRRFDPPVAIICGQSGYAGLVASMVRDLLDGEVAEVLFRNRSINLPFPARVTRDLTAIGDVISESGADLVIGSSFEHYMAPGVAWVGITPPLRGKVRLSSPAVAGTEGALFLLEQILNACVGQKRGR